MTQKILFLVVGLGLSGVLAHRDLQQRPQQNEEFVIGPAEAVSMQTEGQCMPARLMKKPMILPKQKCRLG